MPEIIKDERKVIRKEDGSLLFILNQEQTYTEENRTKMLEACEKEIKEKTEWVKNFPKHLKASTDQVTQEMNSMKEKIEKDIEHLKEGIAIWSKVEGDN